MKGLFAPDSGLMRFFTAFFDLVVLNLLTAVLCLPIVTAGAALTSMDYCILKMARNEESYILKSYFKSFKENFKQATLLWIPLFIFLMAAFFDMYFMRVNSSLISKPAAIIFGIGFLFIFLVSVWIFPLLCHFYYDSVTSVIKNAFLLMLSHFPRTLLMALMTIAPIILLYFKPYQSLAFVVLFGLSLPAFGCAYLYSSVFKTMEPDEGEEDEIEEELHVIDKLGNTESESIDKKGKESKEANSAS